MANMKKNKLYHGDSSDEEYATYFKDTIIRNINKLSDNQKIKFLSSFILEEVSQSILEDHNILNTYIKKKNSVALNKAVLKYLASEINDTKVDKFLFGQHLIYKQTGSYSNEWLKQFYDNNLEKIKAFKNKIGILQTLNDLQKQVADYKIENFDFTKVQILFDKYFIGSNIQEAIKKYFKNTTFNAIQDAVAKNQGATLNLSPTGKSLLKKKDSKEIKEFFEKEFLNYYYQELLELKIKDKNQNNFKEFLTFLDLDNYDKSLIDIYANHRRELFNLLTNKKAKTSEDSLSIPDTVITELYISNINITSINAENNKKINNALLKLRPQKFFSEDIDNQDAKDFFANFKLDHRIIRSKIKEVGIDDHRDASIGHNIFISDFTINTDTEISKGGARTDYRKLPLKGQSSAYSNLANNELNIKPDSAKLLKLLLQKIIREQEIKEEEINNVLVNSQDIEFLYKFTDLLFHCESERNVSAFLTNAMFFDLVEAGVYRIDDLANRLPMAIKKDEDKTSGPGAVAGARYLLDLLGGSYGETSPYLTKRQYYDFGETNEAKAIELATRDTLILLDWLANHKELQKHIDKTYKISYQKKYYHNGFFLAEDSVELSQIANELNTLYSLHTAAEYHKENSNNLISAVNLYIRNLFSKPLLSTSMEIDSGEKGTTIKDEIFKALHNLVYEWYGIRLDYLYSFDEFKKDNKDKFLNEQNVKLIELVNKIHNITKLNTLRFISKENTSSIIEVENERIIELYKKEGSNSLSVIYPSSEWDKSLKEDVLRLIKVLLPSAGDTISLHDTTSLLDLIRIKFEKSKYLKDQFEKWVDESWNSKAAFLAHNDQELLKYAKPVQGFYSNDDVNLLIEALLKEKELSRNNLSYEVIGNNIGLKTYILDGRSLNTTQITVNEEDYLNSLKNDIDKILLENKNTALQILMPIRLKTVLHWATVQLKVDQDQKIQILIYDSAYKDTLIKDDIIFELKKLYNIGTFTSIEHAKVIKIQVNVKNKCLKDVYCGGYTAHLISNLAITPNVAEGNELSIWGVNKNSDEQRHIDANLVNQTLPEKSLDFGKLGDNLGSKKKSQEKDLLREENAKYKFHELEEIFSHDDKIELPEKLINFIATIKKEDIFKTDKNFIDKPEEFLNLIREIPKEIENNLGFLKEDYTSEDKDRIFSTEPEQILYILKALYDQNMTKIDEINGMAQRGKGLTAESINLNLDEIIKSHVQSDLQIDHKIINAQDVADNILDWLANQNTSSQYASLVKVENAIGQKHAILVYTKQNNNQTEITLIDPLSQEDTEFAEQLNVLKAVLNNKALHQVRIIYAGCQDRDYGTCSDMCLIMLQELIEKSVNSYYSYSNYLEQNQNYNDLCHNFDYVKSQQIELIGQDHHDTI